MYKIIHNLVEIRAEQVVEHRNCFVWERVYIREYRIRGNQDWNPDKLATLGTQNTRRKQFPHLLWLHVS